MNRLWPLTLRGTGALALALLCFVLASELQLPELIYFGILLLGVLAASVASLYVTHRADAVTRTVSSEVAAVARTSTVTVRVSVRTAVPSAPGRWSDTLPRTLTGEARGTFPALGSSLRGAADRTVELTYPVTGVRRGVEAIGPLRLTSSDPFGLARRHHVLGERTPVTVVPTVVDLPPLSSFAGEAGGVLHTSTTQLGQGADNLIARPYAPGDSMRRIHWRATAHRDELMVRQEEQESTPEATVILDRGALRWAPEAMQAPGADAGFEVAVSACVSAVARLAKEGYTVEVIDSDGTPLAESLDGADAGELEQLLVQFATLTARRDDHLGRLPKLFSGVTMGPVVLIVGRFDPPDAAVIAPVAHHSTLPLLLAVAPVGDALDRAADFGWRCASIGPDTDLVAAWVGVVDRGVSSVLR